MCGGELVDALINRKRRGHVIEREVLTQGLQIQRRTDSRVRQQDLWFRCEQERVVKDPPVERLLTKAIARHKQSPALRVPQSKREHAIEVLDHVLAVFLVKMRQDFGIRRTAKSVAALLEV